MQEAASALHRAVRDAETAAEEKLATAARQAKREADFLQNELTDAAAAHEAVLKASDKLLAYMPDLAQQQFMQKPSHAT